MQGNLWTIEVFGLNLWQIAFYAALVLVVGLMVRIYIKSR